ncbi:hypothetical protein BGW42_006709 [Actinomortierella wolfii]|nr:hypothetical protein BGW42_006709 [Actinomortierella wolfii]
MRYSLVSLASLAVISAATLQAAKAEPVEFRRHESDHHKSSSCHLVKFTDMVVFGDSYADSGNTYKLTHHEWPGSPYYHGHFSNGRMWPEYVAEHKGYHQSNYAYFGATLDNRLVQGYADSHSKYPVPGFWQQVERYHDKHMDRHDHKKLEKTLFVIDFKGYDYYYKPNLEVDVVVKHYELGIRRLIEIGAKHIYVIGGIDVSKTPYYRTSHEHDHKVLHKFMQYHLAAIKQMVWKLHYEYGRPVSDETPFQWCPADYKYLHDHSSHHRKSFDNHVNVAWFDTEALLERIRKTSWARKKLGITNVNKPCYVWQENTVCPNPDTYMYWDDLHLTTKVHKEIAFAIEKHL